MSSFHYEGLLLVNLITFASAVPVESNFAQVPFLTVWNAPTASCLSQYGVDLDLGLFNIVQNQNQTFIGGNITIFYAEKLGLYPRYSNQEVAINGGVPQNASLAEHLKAASENIFAFIPEKNFQGLAVIDWESWRPLWERNWDSKQIYWKASRALVRRMHPEWTPAQVEAEARNMFEAAGRKFMEETLKLGERERPNGLWGYYGFPNCYNYYSEKITNYTGECPAIEIKRNNKLQWLWEASSALYPDIYLSLNLRGLGKEVLRYANHRILEAMRVGAQATPVTLPVFTYSRIVYTYSLDFLSEASSSCLRCWVIPIHVCPLLTPDSVPSCRSTWSTPLERVLRWDQQVWCSGVTTPTPNLWYSICACVTLFELDFFILNSQQSREYILSLIKT